MSLPAPNDAPARVGILVLDYHNPRETADCVASLLAREPATTRILWIENDADATREELAACLATVAFPWVEVDPAAGAPPPSGTVGILRCPGNLGYAGGNNVGLRLLHRLGVPFAWVLNNDTFLTKGNTDLLVAAAEARPEVGAWGTAIHTDDMALYYGGVIRTRDFSIRHANDPGTLERDPLAFVSGCSLFMRTAVAAGLGFLPEDYFLYYEDPSFSLLLRAAGYALSGLPEVQIEHLGSLATGWRSPLMEFYSRRNRWLFVARFFPRDLARQRRLFWYHVQKYLFRFRFDSLKVEWLARKDWLAGRTGRTDRTFSRAKTSRRRTDKP
jgi:GT2 family glycosyltransferase